jgi:hypothetical protein
MDAPRMLNWNVGTPTLGRARRFPVRISLHYRSVGDPQWREGRTENISHSGVLFRTDDLMPLRTPIEMLLELPIELGGGQHVKVTCRGRVARMEPAPDASATRPAIAATIVGYRIGPPQEATRTST